MGGYEDGNKSKKRIAIIGVSSFILVAMVVAVVGGVSYNNMSSDEEAADAAPSNNKQGKSDISASVKAIKSLCQPTDHKKLCEDTLKKSAGNTTDPKELVKVAFNIAIKYINNAANKSQLLDDLEKDPKSKAALGVCKEMMNYAIGDIEKSFDSLGEFDISKLDEMLDDLKVWLSGAITYQETCLDGFQNLTTDAGAKMKKVLKTSEDLTSNGLAMVEEISTILSQLQIPGINMKRRLMGHDELPSWVDHGRRNLLSTSVKKIKPNVTVAKDGSGDFKTINEALQKIEKKSNYTFVLYVKKGVYDEHVVFESYMHNVLLIGDGPTKTTITGALNFADGTPTCKTATVTALGDYFMAKDIGFENSAGALKHQAVALRVQSDYSVFHNCRMDGYQDTLYVHAHRQFYRDCIITGTIDFIFGDAAAVFQNCTMQVRKPEENQFNAVTAQGRKERRQSGAIVIQNCNITAHPELEPVKAKFKTYLGRPWKPHARTIIMESYIDDLIAPEGWTPWAYDVNTEGCLYAEFNNRGPGSSTKNRAKWKGIKKIKKATAVKYTSAYFIGGNRWVPQTGVPYVSGFTRKSH
uniref:Pectinesterase n=1 Tax=Kalanchoe fedtschenkoi TaxID=63787 RepID=A0A7N0ZRU0_KALFE